MSEIKLTGTGILNRRTLKCKSLSPSRLRRVCLFLEVFTTINSLATNQVFSCTETEILTGLLHILLPSGREETAVNRKPEETHKQGATPPSC